MYRLTALGNHELPRELETATEDDVEAVVVRAAAHLGFQTDEIRRVTSILGGSCIACVDVVAYAGGTALIVARPTF